MMEVKKDDYKLSEIRRFFTEKPAGIFLRRACRRLIRDRRIWFCLIVYPLLFIAVTYLKSSDIFAFLRKHSMECFFALSFVFILIALGLVLDVFQLLTLKAQGGKLKIKEQDGKNDDENTEGGK